jgi:alpha-beta hydrolase superfamily lysophospholipase
MMAGRKPTLVLVPGSFNYAKTYIPLIEKFKSTGYSLHTIDLRTVGKKPGPPPTIYDDAAFIASEVEKLADEGKEMVLVGHSYGGIPISQCMEGLSRAAREKEGKQGGVVRIAYMTALVPALGESAVVGLEGCPTGYTEADEVSLLRFSSIDALRKTDHHKGWLDA